LNIKTENPALAHQLSLLSGEIVKRYHQKLGNGAIKGIRVKIGALNPASKIPIQSEVVEDKQITDDQRQIIDTCVTEIHDPKLSDIVSRTIKRAFLHNQKVLDAGGHPCRSCKAVIDLEFEYCPCCERKIKEETKAYLDYLKKNNKDLAGEDLKVLDGVGHLFLHDFK
jgi:hypothetical protein